MFRLYDQNKNTNIQPEKQLKPLHRSIYSLIPLNIFQTWHSLELPDKMRENSELLQKDNPEFSYYLYDDQMCRDFIQTHFDEETVWAFDKLKPGAYKADLWRYCVLYIHGGIYLDIKYRCVNHFKLIQLTDKEYWVKDRKMDIDGIYQALMVTYPNNNILKQAIQKIIEYCRYNVYSLNALAISGPTLLGTIFNEIEINRLILTFGCGGIIKDTIPILQEYIEYRSEQQDTQNTLHYGMLWESLDCFHYPTLMSVKKYNLSKNIEKNIDDNNFIYNASIPIIYSKNDEIVIHLEYIHHYYHDGVKVYSAIENQCLYSQSTIDFHLENHKEEVFYDFDNTTAHNLRLIQCDDSIYYIVDLLNKQSNRFYISSNEFIIENDTININYINQTRYCNKNPINNISFFQYNNELSIVYKWFPLQIGKIDYTNQRLVIDAIKYNTPQWFEDITSATMGVSYKNEIWFILCSEKRNFNKLNNKRYFSHKHIFAIFDSDMKIKKYSEFFSFDGHKNEFCKSFVIKDEQIIIGYGLSNRECYIASYEIDSLFTQLKWFNVQGNQCSLKIPPI
jgi:hypothetical protein